MTEALVILWPFAQALPELPTGNVHVWCWDMRAPPQTVLALRSLLSKEEQQRADRFVFERDRIRFTLAHSRLRQILAHYSGEDARKLTFETSQQGKPALTRETGIRFNLSHSQNLAVAAVSRNIELGVDVEFIKAVSEGIAERFFTPAEQLALQSLSAESRLAGFFECWTRKEALLKGFGTGITGGLDSFSVSLGTRQPIEIDFVTGEDDGWRLEHLDPAPGYVGALACKAKSWSTSCFALSSTDDVQLPISASRPDRPSQ